MAVIDSLPFGGTCELRGCDPKKVLVGVSELIDWSHRMQGKGASAPAMSVNWSDLIRFKRTFTDPVPEDNEQSFKDAGISAFRRRRFIHRGARGPIKITETAARLSQVSRHFETG